MIYGPIYIRFRRNMFIKPSICLLLSTFVECIICQELCSIKFNCFVMGGHYYHCVICVMLLYVMLQSATECCTCNVLSCHNHYTGRCNTTSLKKFCLILNPYYKVKVQSTPKSCRTNCHVNYNVCKE